jgi:two-component system CheB/CheR fusion protein
MDRMADGNESAGRKDGPSPAQLGEADSSRTAMLAGPGQAPDDIIRLLKEELETARRDLRIKAGQYEAGIEELRAANRQLRAVNEEYRAAAAKLEAGRKELQSVNEELRTVNAEFKAELGRVSRAHAELQNLMEASDAGTLHLDRELRIERFTPRVAELLGIGPADKGRLAGDFTHKLDWPAFAADAQAVLNEAQIVEREIGSNGSWYLTRLHPYRTVDGGIEGVVWTFVDITARFKSEEALKASEARLRLLLSELSHRMKNTLAVVQSMARQSFRGNVSPEKGLENFLNRLRALAEAHNVLANSEWRGADLRALAARQLSAYAKADGKAVILEGPAVSIPPDIANPLALVLHELAANAMKYGALSSPAGVLRLEWDFAQGAAGRVLRLAWRESGGPAVEPPSTEGFGSWLIQFGLPEAEVSLSYPEDGVVCTIALPEGCLQRA